MRSILNNICRILLVCIFCPLSLQAQQMQEVESHIIHIGYDKTFHVIFPADIKYVNIGNENIAGDVVDNVQRVLRLKANYRDFTGVTNVAVVTSDSKYHTFSVSYRDNPEVTYLNMDMGFKEPPTIYITDDKLVHLILPEKVIYVDFGDITITVNKAEGVDNIIYLKALERNFRQTNVSVFTESGSFYTFNVTYMNEPPVLSFVIDNFHDIDRVAILDDKELNNFQKEILRKDIAQLGRLKTNLNKKVSGARMAIHNIIVDKHILFFKMEIANSSQVDYDIDFIKFYIQDKKKAKKTAIQQLVMEPLFFFDYKTHIPAHERMIFTIAMNKFTIPDKKVLLVEIQEAGGGRHFLYKVKNKHIINAQMLYLEPLKGQRIGTW